MQISREHKKGWLVKKWRKWEWGRVGLQIAVQGLTFSKRLAVCATRHIEAY